MIQHVIDKFGVPRDVNGDGGRDEQRRMDILADLAEFTHFAVHGDFVLIRTNKGRCLLEKQSRGAANLVVFMYQSHNTTGCESFWFNASSVQHLGEMLRANQGKRVPMERMMVE